VFFNVLAIVAKFESDLIRLRTVGEGVLASHRSESFRDLGAAFVAGGDRYERLRPAYPDEVVSWMVEGTPVAGVVADVGAGTGKLTSALVARGFDVVAVDPSADMLAQLGRLLPGVVTQVGTGETTGLADGTVDLVTFAQSWHWVEPTAGSLETARVLKHGGRAAWVWNFIDVREPWVAELADIWHTIRGDEASDPSRHLPVLGTLFGPMDAITVDWTQPMLTVDLAELVTTRSYYLNASIAERHKIDSDVAAFLEARFPNVDTVDLPYRTYGFKAELT
jgi:SAM-dependent methyltransferase